MQPAVSSEPINFNLQASADVIIKHTNKLQTLRCLRIMGSKSYSISPAKIGSQDGFRLPKAFSHDHPNLVSAKGYIEMVDQRTFLVHFDPDDDLDPNPDEDEELMVKIFLDTLIKFAQDKPDSLTPYTQQMADAMDDLLAGVTVDEDE